MSPPVPEPSLEVPAVTATDQGLEPILLTAAYDDAVTDQAFDAAEPSADAPREVEVGAETTKSRASNMATATAKLCCVCGGDTARYKCTRCTQPFCSVACNRVHQETHPDASEPKLSAAYEQSDKAHSLPPHEQSDPYRVLLDHAKDFKSLFGRYPMLEQRLGAIYEQTLRPADDEQVGFRGGLPWKLGKGGQPPQKQEPWTREAGLRNGAAALRQARTDPGEVGDGVREYCDLVLYILAKQESRDITNIVRTEVVQEDTKVIERLLREDQR